MTPKEKARKLVDKFYNATDDHWNQWYVAKQCALIAVEEILNIKPNNPFIVNGYYKAPIQYWREVKQEIEKL
jgi:hypothetical protein